MHIRLKYICCNSLHVSHLYEIYTFNTYYAHKCTNIVKYTLLNIFALIFSRYLTLIVLHIRDNKPAGHPGGNEIKVTKLA